MNLDDFDVTKPVGMIDYLRCRVKDLTEQCTELDDIIAAYRENVIQLQDKIRELESSDQKD